MSEINLKEKMVHSLTYFGQFDTNISSNQNTLRVHVLLLCDFPDLRPKGRGRPQRILLGVWPDEHIRGVIRAVVFRDTHAPCATQATNLKELELPVYPAIAPVSITPVAYARLATLHHSLTSTLTNDVSHSLHSNRT